MANTDLNISLEPHLIEALVPLLDILPLDLRTRLTPYISSSPPATIQYSILHAISQWARTGEGTSKLSSVSLHPSSYTMISLLAGTKTSPERQFGSYTPPPSAEELASRQNRDKRAITAILNALLSIFGVGFTTWWAADRLHWKNEWRVLLAFFASLAVAAAEGGLYLLWSTRHSSSRPHRKLRRRRVIEPAVHKKVDPPDESLTEKAQGQENMEIQHANNLRQRRR